MKTIDTQDKFLEHCQLHVTLNRTANVFHFPFHVFCRLVCVHIQRNVEEYVG